MVDIFPLTYTFFAMFIVDELLYIFFNLLMFLVV